MRIGQDHFFTALQDGAHRNQEGRRGPGCNYHLVGTDIVNAVCLRIIVTNSFAKYGGPEAVCIMSIAPGQGLYRRVSHGPREY